jgi:translin
VASAAGPNTQIQRIALPPGTADVTAPSSDLARLGEPVRERFAARHDARELALASSRDAIRAAANAIRAIHRREFGRADDLISDARGALRAALDATDGHPEVRHAGFVQDAAKEVAEAVLTRSAVTGERLPGPDDVAVDDASWLHGLAETVGELRRAGLDHVRRGEHDEAERLLDLMQEILAVLVTIDAPDGLTRGLRRATDAARAITERTRGDLTTAAGQRDLRAALDAHREVLEQVLAEN